MSRLRRLAGEGPDFRSSHWGQVVISSDVRIESFTCGCCGREAGVWPERGPKTLRVHKHQSLCLRKPDTPVQPRGRKWRMSTPWGMGTAGSTEGKRGAPTRGHLTHTDSHTTQTHTDSHTQSHTTDTLRHTDSHTQSHTPHRYTQTHTPHRYIDTHHTDSHTTHTDTPHRHTISDTYIHTDTQNHTISHTTQTHTHEHTQRHTHKEMQCLGRLGEDGPSVGGNRHCAGCMRSWGAKLLAPNVAQGWGHTGEAVVCTWSEWSPQGPTGCFWESAWPQGLRAVCGGTGEVPCKA